MDSASLRQLAQSWETLASKSLPEGKTLEAIATETLDGNRIDALYWERPPLSTDELAATKAAPVDHRLRAIGNSAVTQNAHLLRGLKGGVTSLELAHLADLDKGFQLEQRLHDVQLSIVSISLQAEHFYAEATQELKQLWAQRKLDNDNVSAAFNADPVGTLTRSGFLLNPIEKELHTLGQFALQEKQRSPNCSSVMVNIATQHNAGASDVQELSAAIATAKLYLDAMLNAGMKANDAIKSIVFQVACDADHLLSVVKLRVLHTLWQHLAQGFGATHLQLNLVVETSTRMLSAQTPWVNHLRNVSAASAALMAGANTVIVQPHDFLDEQFIDEQHLVSERVARNTSIILEQECALHKINDPMAGAYAVESMCQDLLDNTWSQLQTLETEGGFIKALQSGHWQRAVTNMRTKRIQRLLDEQSIAVGVNRFQQKDGYSVGATSGNNDVKKSPVSAALSIEPLVPQRDAAAFEEQG